MNKTQLIEALAERLGDEKIAAAAVAGLVDVVIRTVNGGDKVTITGFGVFEKRARVARVARNPRTGQSVKVKKTNVPAFRPGTLFREVVSGARTLPPPHRTSRRARRRPPPRPGQRRQRRRSPRPPQRPPRRPPPRSPRRRPSRSPPPRSPPPRSESVLSPARRSSRRPAVVVPATRCRRTAPSSCPFGWARPIGQAQLPW